MSSLAGDTPLTADNCCQLALGRDVVSPCVLPELPVPSTTAPRITFTQAVDRTRTGPLSGGRKACTMPHVAAVVLTRSTHLVAAGFCWLSTSSVVVVAATLFHVPQPAAAARPP